MQAKGMRRTVICLERGCRSNRALLSCHPPNSPGEQEAPRLWDHRNRQAHARLSVRRRHPACPGLGPNWSTEWKTVEFENGGRPNSSYLGCTSERTLEIYLLRLRIGPRTYWPIFSINLLQYHLLDFYATRITISALKNPIVKVKRFVTGSWKWTKK